MKQPTAGDLPPVVQTLRGIFVHRWKGQTVIIWDPNACDDISRRAWLGLTADMRRQKEAQRGDRTG